jgi:DnaJ-class molecular chaperone
MKKCKTCGGSGETWVTCPSCGGRATLMCDRNGEIEAKCRTCHGEGGGMVVCQECKGTGVKRK